MMDRIRVLHVDGDPQFAEMAARLLGSENEDLEVVSETRASDALAYLRDDSSQVDCVVSNYTLPDSDGVAFLETLRSEYPDLPFILFTGRSSEAIASSAVTAGATDYLQKSGRPEQYKLLANRIENAVDQYRANRRAAALDRLRTISRGVNRKLVRANSREEAERDICEVITGTRPYRLAWIGTVDPDTDSVEPHVAAGDGVDYLEGLTIALDEDRQRRGPTGRAVSERRVAVSENFAEDPAFQPWQETALEYGLRSGAVVPLEYGQTLYGVLAVYAESPRPFDEAERTLLRELGDDIGQVFHSFEVKDRVRRERDRRRALFENAPVAVVVSTPEADGHVIRDVNDAFEDVFGYEAADVIGKDATEVLIPEANRGQHGEFRRRVEAGEAIVTEAERLTADGRREFVLHLIPFGADDDAVSGVYAWYTDITERKERERQLERSQDLLRHTETLVDVGGWEIDVETEAVRWTDGAYAIRDLPVDSDIEPTLEDAVSFYHPDDREATERAIRRCLEGGEPYDRELRLITDRDRERWIRVVGEPVYEDGELRKVRGAIRDITEQKERERRIQQT